MRKSVIWVAAMPYAVSTTDSETLRRLHIIAGTCTEPGSKV